MAFMSHLLLFVVLYNTNNSLQSSLIQNYLPACMAASFVYDRIKQFVNKLYTFILITITAWSLKSQRHKFALTCLIINFILFLPYILPLIVLSSLLSAPVLPLFTFPIFILGFPRSKRFWPDQSIGDSKQTTNPDSYFYSQMTPHLLNSLKECILSGSIGSSVESDMFFITRFQDRIIWIQILEVSSTYCLVNIKGLELQETSCHTREAQYIDDTFESAFEINSKISPNKFDCLRPCDLMIVKAYSDAKNTLVGIIDSPDCFRQLCEFYPKVLHFFLIKYLISKTGVDKNSQKKESISKIETETTSMMIKPKNRRLSPIIQKSELKATTTLPDINQVPVARKLNLNDSMPDWSDTDSLFDDLYNDNEKKKKPKKKNIKSKTETVVDDFDATIFDIIGNNKKIESNYELKSIAQSSNVNNYETVSNDEFVSNSILSIPSKWTRLLKNVETKQADDFTKTLRTTLSSVSWFNKVLETIDKKHANQNGLLNDYQNNFTLSHFNFLLKCCTCLGKV